MPAEAPMKRLMLSPLRYPGGKGSLYPRLRQLVRSNDLVGGTYVEPYAGGAGAGLALLITGQVKNLVINDLDPSVYAFWRAVTDEPDEFRRLTINAKLTVKEWRNQKSIQMNADRSEHLTLGFSTFYLNRTNRSGVLNGGPIGGHDQSGPYKIDARFNRPALLERLRLVGLHASNIAVTNQDGVSVIKRYLKRKSSLIYADPPYFEKAGTLYLNSFRADDHVRLASCLNEAPGARWLLTYDDVSQIADLYPQRRTERFSLSYSAHRVVRTQEMMIFSDGLSVPWRVDQVEATPLPT